jgi:hypothetical protein
MGAALRAWLVAAVLGAALPLQANEPTHELTLTPSLASCLSPAAAERGTPEYPDELWTEGRRGLVMVELAFAGPDQPAEVRIRANDGGPEFVESVRRHVRALRLPCAVGGEALARVRLNFVFNPVDRKRFATELVDPDTEAAQRQLACVVNRAGKAPDYPMAARRAHVQGRVRVEMSFFNAHDPPKLTIHARRASRELLPAVRDWVEAFRMPCHAGEPVVAWRTLIFRFEGDTRYGFKNKQLKLLEFLGGIRDIENKRADFDFDTMGCPFDVRLQYLQPKLRNVVTQVSVPMLSRQPLLHWLAAAELKLDELSQDAVFADTLLLTVPCGHLKL